MTSAYFLRLLCLSLASFFALNAVLTLLVRGLSRFALAFAERRTPRNAARFLFALRLLPVAFAALFVVALCIPSYLWLEPSATPERIGPMCAALGILAAAACAFSTIRSARVLFASLRFNRFCASHGQQMRVPGQLSAFFVVENRAPVLAMAGVLHPRLLVSRSVLQALTPDELDAALRHESAHRASRDNFKRLLFLLAPDVFPFTNSLRLLERHWSRFTEWAADDQAAAGNSVRALSLASALLRVARLGAAPHLPALSTSLLACQNDLSARVDRLLRPSQLDQPQSMRRASLVSVSLLFVAVGSASLLFSPVVLSSVHNLLEHFLR